MSPTPDGTSIRWKLHLRSAPQQVYDTLNTDEGRARFWAESARETNGEIEFIFPGGQQWRSKVLEREPHKRFQVEYYGGSITTFVLESDGAGGTILLLEDQMVLLEDYAEVMAGWVSVLLALKAAVDFGVDLRNHDPEQTWGQGFADN